MRKLTKVGISWVDKVRQNRPNFLGGGQGAPPWRLRMKLFILFYFFIKRGFFRKIVAKIWCFGALEGLPCGPENCGPRGSQGNPSQGKGDPQPSRPGRPRVIINAAPKLRVHVLAQLPTGPQRRPESILRPPNARKILNLRVWISGEAPKIKFKKLLLVFFFIS